MLTITLDRICQAYGFFLYVCGLLAGAACFAMMALIVANVAGRFFFNLPVPITFEITKSTLTVLVFLSLALTQYNEGHIRVSVLTRSMQSRFRRPLNTAMLALSALLFGMASYATWFLAIESWSVGEQSRSLIQFPLYPVKFVVFFGVLLLAIQFALDTLRAAAGLSPQNGLGGDTPKQDNEVI